MFNITPKIIETVFAIFPNADDTDFDEIATRSIIGLQSNLADLNNHLLSVRGKKITDKRREATTQMISNALFYAAILIHLNDLPPDLFDMDAEAEEGIVSSTGLFDEVYFHSPLMLGNHLLGIATDIGEYMWSEKFSPDEPPTTHLAATPTTSAETTELEIPDETGYHGFMKNLLEGAASEYDEDDTFSPDDYDSEEIMMMIDRLLAGLTIMADLCDIDIGVCMYNASQQEAI